MKQDYSFLTQLQQSTTSIQIYQRLMKSATCKRSTNYNIKTHSQKKVVNSADIICRYADFLEPPVIQNVQRKRCADPEEEKKRNRVALSDLLKENPENQQV